MRQQEADGELARRHYWIAEMTAREGLPVDWHFVAVRMAQALDGLPEARLGEGDVLWPQGNAQADGHAPVGAEQGAPRLRRGEEP
jgi:hypothetical protein